MTHTDLAVLAARPVHVYHHYNNHTSGSGHLSGGAVAAIIVVAVLVAIAYFAYKHVSDNN